MPPCQSRRHPRQFWFLLFLFLLPLRLPPNSTTSSIRCRSAPIFRYGTAAPDPSRGFPDDAVDFRRYLRFIAAADAPLWRMLSIWCHRQIGEGKLPLLPSSNSATPCDKCLDAFVDLLPQQLFGRHVRTFAAHPRIDQVDRRAQVLQRLRRTLLSRMRTPSAVSSRRHLQVRRLQSRDAILPAVWAAADPCASWDSEATTFSANGPDASMTSSGTPGRTRSPENRGHLPNRSRE